MSLKCQKCSTIHPDSELIYLIHRCYKFENVPSNCVISKDQDNCCDVAVCYDPSVTTPNPVPTVIGGTTIPQHIIPTRNPGKHNKHVVLT